MRITISDELYILGKNSSKCEDFKFLDEPACIWIALELMSSDEGHGVRKSIAISKYIQISLHGVRVFKFCLHGLQLIEKAWLGLLYSSSCSMGSLTINSSKTSKNRKCGYQTFSGVSEVQRRQYVSYGLNHANWDGLGWLAINWILAT